MKLTITINCGETTCASEPGKFCEYLCTRKFGQVYCCGLFMSGGDIYTVLDEKDGWLLRCKECLDHD